MAVKVKLQRDEFPEGQEFDFGGLLFKNGEERELSEEEELAFVSRNRKSLKDFAGTKDDRLLVTGTPKYSPEQVAEMYPEPSFALPETPTVVMEEGQPEEKATTKEEEEK
jgi:hypothetical protein